MTDPLEFQPFAKLPRLSRDCVITEKLDGTNAQILIAEIPPGYDVDDPANCGVWIRNGFLVRAGSRTRWLTLQSDNYGFAQWVLENAGDLTKLGPGRHFGEWWGAGIQRRYGLTEKRFSLFNAGRWLPSPSGDSGVSQAVSDPGSELPEILVGPSCCHVVPVLYLGAFDTRQIDAVAESLREQGSAAAPGFMDPEGIVVYHTASGALFKKTLKDDEMPKSLLPI